MTGSQPGRPATPSQPATPAMPSLPSEIGGAMTRLTTAADAAERLGLPAAAARAVVAEATERMGFPADVYVLALVGGTGVGKSSLLNVLAGSMVSPASVMRPTTAAPVAWVPAGARGDLDGLLAWLDVQEVHEHVRTELASVAIIDLPDMDSIAVAHRERVDVLLPKVDAVAWVTDPEKYHDAVLVDEFLRVWLPRLDRQAIVLNKVDRLDPEDRERIRRDIEADLARGGLQRDGAVVPVLATSTREGDAAMRELVDWLTDGADAKRTVWARLIASMSNAGAHLAQTAGIDPRGGRPAPFLDDRARSAAVDAVTAAVLAAVDLPGLERQAVAATRAQARRRGTGPIGVVTSLLYRLSGRAARVADPDAYLVRWRDRGPLAPAAEALRAAIAEPLRVAAPAVRPALAAAADPGPLQASLGAAVDRAVVRQDRTVPQHRLWSLIGSLQTVASAAIAVSVAWVVVWILARPPVDSLVLPILGPVPMPLVAVFVSLAVGYLLARLLGLHAGWVGRRWAGRLRREIAEAVEREIGAHGLEALDDLEAARTTLWESTAGTQPSAPLTSATTNPR